MFQMYEEWGRRLKKLKKVMNEWMQYEKENKETEVYDDLRILRANYVMPAIRLYNCLRRQEFIRSSDYTKLDLKTEQAVMAYNKLVMDYTGPLYDVTSDPDGISTAMVDLAVLNNYQ